MQKVAINGEKMKTRILALIFLAFAGVMSIWQSYLQLTLFPPGTSPVQAVVVTSSDTEEGGTSTISRVKDQDDEIHVRYALSNRLKFPYSSLGIVLEDRDFPDAYVDLSDYSTLRFSIACDPKNTLIFSLNTFDSDITDSSNFNTFRQAVTSFGCHKSTTDVAIDLRKLEIPEWWLKRNGLELTDNAYRLDQVYSFSIVNSSQSPVEVESSYRITNVYLEGRSLIYLYAAYGFVAAIVLLVGYWMIGLHSNRLVRELRLKIQETIPVTTYKEVKLDVKKDRDIKAIQEFVGTHYTNPNLNLEFLGSSLGINRTKINDLLKAQTGLTFTAYLNRLRLAEAARLLQENNEANVSETAYAVGYRNTSYFNTIFKKQFGCTPNTFKKKGRD